MKKIFLTLCILVGIISLNSCGANKGVGLNENAQLYTVSEQWKKDAVKEVAGKLNELAGDSNYIEAIASGEIAEYCDMLKEAKIDGSKYADVYIVKDSLVEDIFEREGMEPDEFSDTARERMKESMLSIVGNQMSSRFGVKSVSIFSIFQIHKTYAIDKPFENQIWIIPTDNDSVYIFATITSSDELYPLCGVSCQYIYTNDAENVHELFQETLALFNLESEQVELN